MHAFKVEGLRRSSEASTTSAQNAISLARPRTAADMRLLFAELNDDGLGEPTSALAVPQPMTPRRITLPAAPCIPRTLIAELTEQLRGPPRKPELPIGEAMGPANAAGVTDARASIVQSCDRPVLLIFLIIIIHIAHSTATIRVSLYPHEPGTTDAFAPPLQLAAGTRSTSAATMTASVAGVGLDAADVSSRARVVRIAPARPYERRAAQLGVSGRVRGHRLLAKPLAAARPTLDEEDTLRPQRVRTLARDRCGAARMQRSASPRQQQKRQHAFARSAESPGRIPPGQSATALHPATRAR